jgi:methionine synthase I (cobalamin-dependent)
MGTELQTRGLPLGTPGDLWNLSRPDDVQAVSRAYVEAGARILLTNTFRANPISLAPLGAADQTVAINRRGVEIARAAGRGAARVFGAIGPIGKVPGDAAAAFRAQAEALAEAGADGLVLETFGDLNEARLALRAARCTGLPLVISFTFVARENGWLTLDGASPEQAARIALEESADALGANCVAVDESFAALVHRLRDASGLPLWLKPSAGLPLVENGKVSYPISPAAFAAQLDAALDAGASFAGGCCGTTPAHIQALAAILGR